jgi:ABC-type glycerol-3-phosphate transport system substrate-binding protein
MSRTIALLLAAAMLAACSGPGPGARCDDGGDGGVVIDGVCL